MRRLSLFILAFTIVKMNLYAQSQTAAPVNISKTSYDYYIIISGIRSREDVLYLQNLIGQKTGISFFMADRYPVRYFLMKSGTEVPLAKLEHWLNSNLYRIEFYKEGKESREAAINFYNRTKKTRS